MTLWFILVIMTAAALAAVAWPLARGRAPTSGVSDLAVYRDQLEEIERDRADGRIGHDEFEAARIEVSRRLLGAAASAGEAEARPHRSRRVAALAGAVIALPLVAVPFYALRGSPGVPAARLIKCPDEDGNALISCLEQHIAEDPDDGRLWESIAPGYLQAERYGDAVKAIRNALKLLGATARREADLGIALEAAAGGAATPDSTAAFQRAAALAEQYIAAHPREGEAWEWIAPLYLKLKRFDAAITARRKALALLGSTAEREVNLGTVMMTAARGTITADAKAAFERAAAMDPGNIRAMFALSVAAQQAGNDAEAIRILHELIAKAPPNAPWLPLVRSQLARIAPGAAPPPAASGPTAGEVAAAQDMTPEARAQFIRSMVERLASRLHEDGSDVDGWLRLLRAYRVMGERDKAKTAANEAREALTREPDKLKQLEDGLRSLSLDGQDAGQGREKDPDQAPSGQDPGKSGPGQNGGSRNLGQNLDAKE
jgi:cytochrome c-type biogenesis protein CcmH